MATANETARKIVGDYIVSVAGFPSLSAYERLKGHELVDAIQKAIEEKKCVHDMAREVAGTCKDHMLGDCGTCKKDPEPTPWHRHGCPQCFCSWECGAAACDPAWKRFCPSGELCHVASDGSWKARPETIRESRGVGPLFDPRDVPTVNRYKKGDQGISTERRR